MILELDPRAEAQSLAARIAAHRPRLVGLGVYIWNARPMEALAEAVRTALPDAVVVLGGPEISHEWEAQPIAAFADYIIAGDGETAFARLCDEVLEERRPAERIIEGGRPDLENLQRPYAEYDDTDVLRRFVYVETTRGCPFGCEFCLSSLEPKVRRWPLEDTLDDIERLLHRGARRLKFVDRTFNLDADRAEQVLRFLLERWVSDLVVHFELVPGRLPPRVRDLLRRFPRGGLRLEVGVQTFDEEAAARVGRRQRNSEVEETLRFLSEETGAVVHADLLAGLPGEGLESFGRGFDRLLSLRPAEIQVGILKRLRGTAVARRAAEWGLEFDPHPPYPVTRTPDLSPLDIERLARMARYWERLGNRGRLPRTLPLLWRDGGPPFKALMALSDELFARFGAAHGIAEDDLVRALAEHLIRRGVPRPQLASTLAEDGRIRGRPYRW